MRVILLLLVLVIMTTIEIGSATAEDAQPLEWDAKRVLSVMESVTEHHIDAPPIQTMIMGFLNSLGTSDGSLVSPVGVGRQLSFATRADMEELLEAEIARSDQGAHGRLVRAALDQVLSRTCASKLVLAKDYRVEKQIEANRYVGIGIALGTNAKKEHQMVSVIEGGAAAKAGAKNGDLIVEVDGVSTAGLSVKDVVDLLRGPQGTDVNVSLRRARTADKRYKMTRDVVPFKHVEGFKVLQPGIASIDIKAVSGSIVRDLRQLTAEIEKNEIKGVVLNMRASDADYRSALMFANAMIDGKLIGGIQSTDGIEVVSAEPDQLWPDVEIAMVLLSERCSGALAWAVSGIHVQRKMPVFRQLPGDKFTQAEHAWKFGTVQLDDGDLLIELPVGRFLRGRADGNDSAPVLSEFENGLDNASVVLMQQEMMQFPRTEGNRSRSDRGRARIRPLMSDGKHATPIARAVESLKAKI